MNVVVTDGPLYDMAAYGRIPIAFEVTRVLHVTVRGGEGETGLELTPPLAGRLDL